MGDYGRWSSGRALGGRLRGMILIHQASTTVPELLVFEREYIE